MRLLREILRLRHAGGLSQREIARSLSIGLGTVCECLARAAQAGVSWPLPTDWEDGRLEAVLAGAPGRFLPPSRPLPDRARLHAELRRPGVTLQLLWVEYLRDHPDGYRYTQFCEHYHRFARKLSPPMRQIHRAGEKAFVDFAGQKPWIVYRRTGEVVAGELFVGVLGASSYIYAEAAPSQELPHWIGGHVRMFEFFGGLPAILVPDCLKGAVTTPCRYEPVLNRTYQDLAAHYGTAVIPARPHHPRDKAKVEAGVLVAERWILAALRHRTFFSFAEMNVAIRELVGAINNRPMKHLGASRRELFERLDQPALRPLPPNRYEMAEWKEVTVNIDYHVEVAHNYYSAPHPIAGERVEARATATTVEVFFHSRRIASHARQTGRGHYATRPEHMPASHRAHAEWSPSRLIAWAEKTGPATGRVVAEILRSRPHPEQGYRSCLGILRLAQRHGAPRVEAACARAQRLGAASYKTVKNLLAAGLDTLPFDAPAEAASTLPAHDNVRGAGYYRKEDPC
ncbi:MAG: IS21 family transposase [Actinomycetota bacterium]